MKGEKIFQKYYWKLVWIGTVESMLLALVCGLVAAAVAAIVTIPFYLPVLNIVIIAMSVFGGVFVLATPVLYFVKFKPTAEKMNREIDKLGLDERIVTMEELKKDSSFIALCQREDAKKKLGSVKPSDLKYRISKFTLLALGLSLVLCVSMTAISTLVSVKHAESLENPPDGEEQEDPDREPEYVTVKYFAQEGMGHIEGETEQVLIKGEDAQPVVAVPEEGFVFLKWTDDYIYAERWDWNVLEDLEVEAVFIPMMNGGAEDGRPGDDGGDGGSTQPGGQEGSNGDTPNGEGGNGTGESDDGTGSGAGEEEGGNAGDNFEGDGNSGGGNDTDSPYANSGTGGRSQDNTIIDGETDYKTAIDDDYQEDLENDDTVPDELKELIERYLDSLKP